MRKILLMGVVLLLGLPTVSFSTTTRERREPCAPYDNDRSLSQVEEILTRDGEYYENLRYEYARVYNSISDYKVSATKDGMRDMLDHSVLVESSFFNPEDYENGVKVGNRIEYTNLIGRESKYWLAAADENGQPIDGYMKMNCINIQKRKKPFTRKKETLKECMVVDTIYQTIVNRTIINDTVCHMEYLPPQPPEPMFALMVNLEFGYQQQIPIQPFYYGDFQGGNSYTNIVNNYKYNNVTNNYYNKPDEPDPDKPGPAPVPGHGDGPAPAPGHGDKEYSQRNGSVNTSSNNKGRAVEKSSPASNTRTTTPTTQTENVASNTRSKNYYERSFDQIAEAKSNVPRSSRATTDLNNNSRVNPTKVAGRENVPASTQSRVENQRVQQVKPGNTSLAGNTRTPSKSSHYASTTKSRQVETKKAPVTTNSRVASNNYRTNTSKRPSTNYRSHKPSTSERSNYGKVSYIPRYRQSQPTHSQRPNYTPRLRAPKQYSPGRSSGGFSSSSGSHRSGNRRR